MSGQSHRGTPQNPTNRPAVPSDASASSCFNNLKVGLSRMNVPRDAVETALRIAPPDAVGVLVYGSRARGDHLPKSDLDLLALVDHPAGSRSGDGVNLSCYTQEQLSSASGTLFGMHIRRDGIVVADTGGCLSAIVNTLADPDPSYLISRVRHFSAILEVVDRDPDQNLDGLCRLARYLLRTAIYAQALAEGHPCFSVRELAERYHTPQLVTLLSSDRSAVENSTAQDLDELRSRIAVVAGDPETAGYSTIQALAVGEWETNRERSVLATMALANNAQEFDYSLMPKVLL